MSAMQSQRKILESITFDSKGLTAEQKEGTPLEDVARNVFQQPRRYTQYLAKSLVCVPVGGTAYYTGKSSKGPFVFIVNRAEENKFVITVRNSRAAFSYQGKITNTTREPRLIFEKAKEFLGTAADIEAVCKTVGYSLGSMVTIDYDLSKKLKTPGNRSPFIGLAGDEDSPEREHLQQRYDQDETVLVARPS